MVDVNARYDAFAGALEKAKRRREMMGANYALVFTPRGEGYEIELLEVPRDARHVRSLMTRPAQSKQEVGYVVANMVEQLKGFVLYLPVLERTRTAGDQFRMELVEVCDAVRLKPLEGGVTVPYNPT